MDLIKGKGGKKGLILWTWERCRSFGGVGRRKISISSTTSTCSRSSSGDGGKVVKSKSWPSRLSLTRVPADDDDGVDQQKRAKNPRVAPEGCFSVYVGAEKQRFCINTECLKHPLFRMLLEEAESEYGYTTDGPLELPCEVGLFIKVLMEMDCDEIRPSRCSFSRSNTCYQLLPSPSYIPNSLPHN